MVIEDLMIFLSFRRIMGGRCGAVGVSICREGKAGRYGGSLRLAQHKGRLLGGPSRHPQVRATRRRTGTRRIRHVRVPEVVPSIKSDAAGSEV
jgi:hypothetical protein